MTKIKADDYPPSQATKRRDAALRAALSMPAIPHANPNKKKAKPSKRQQKRQQSGL